MEGVVTMTKGMPFKMTDIKRAIRAVKAAGLEAHRAEIRPDGTIVIVLTSGADGASPFDEWKARADARPA